MQCSDFLFYPLAALHQEVITVNNFGGITYPLTAEFDS